MKSFRFVGIALTLLLAVAAVQAQSLRMRAAIPFDFYINGTALPAGNYEVNRLEPGVAIVMSSFENKASVAFLATSATSPRTASKSKLVFTRYGNQYFLSEIWVAGSDTGRKLPKSKEELRWAMTQPQEASQVTLYAELR